MPHDAEQPQDPLSPTADVLARRLRWARYGVLCILAVTVASAYLTRHCLAVANTTMQRELGFNNEQFGYLYSAFSVGYLICQVPGGWLGQRFGTRLTVPLLSLLWSCMTLVTAVVWAFPLLLSARFGFGLMQAGLIPNQAQVLKDWFPTESRGTASAVVVTAMSVGSVGSLWLTSWLLGFCHWRTLLLSYSLVGMAWSAFFYLAFRTSPKDVKWLHGTESDGLPETRADLPPEAPLPGLSMKDILLNQSFWAMFVQMIFKAAGYNLLVTFFPAYLELAYKISKEDAGRLTSWSLMAVIFGSLAAGRCIDILQRTTGSKWISRCGVGGVSLTLTAGIMWGATFTGNATEMALVIAVSSLIMGLANPCAWAATIDIGGKNTAVVMGFLNMGGAVAGILISPLVGRLIDYIKLTQGNWNWVIHLHAAFYLIAALCWLMVNPERTLNPRENNNAG